MIGHLLALNPGQFDPEQAGGERVDKDGEAVVGKLLPREGGRVLQALQPHHRNL